MINISKLGLTKNILLCVFLSFLQVYIIHNSTIIYVPILFNLVFSLLYGLLEPKKGWILGIIQIIILVGTYWWLDTNNFKASKPDIAAFTTHIGIFPSLFGPLISSFISRM
jgi:hypothetical protein